MNWIKKLDTIFCIISLQRKLILPVVTVLVLDHTCMHFQEGLYLILFINNWKERGISPQYSLQYKTIAAEALLRSVLSSTIHLI